MRCVDCGSRDVMVLETRQLRGGMLRRRRQCKSCGGRFTTVEVPVRLRRKRVEAILTPPGTSALPNPSEDSM